MAGPALYLGRQGATGDTTGEHFHFTLKKDGKVIPFSTARTDVGQYLQYRLPGSNQWVNLYRPLSGGGFAPAPGMEAPAGDRAYGMREQHPVHGDRRMHWGEDYPLASRAQLRFLGQGSVSTFAGRGGAGNVSVLRTPGGYELETYHLSELPESATTRRSDAAFQQLPVQQYPGAQQQAQDTRTADILEAFMYGQEAQKNQKEDKPTFKDQLMAGLLSQAFAPQQNFISRYIMQEPYIQGQAVSTQDYLAGLFL